MIDYKRNSTQGRSIILDSLTHITGRGRSLKTNNETWNAFVITVSHFSVIHFPPLSPVFGGLIALGIGQFRFGLECLERVTEI